MTTNAPEGWVRTETDRYWHMPDKDRPTNGPSRDVRVVCGQRLKRWTVTTAGTALICPTCYLERPRT